MRDAETAVGTRPESPTFEEAAATPPAGNTALIAVRIARARGTGVAAVLGARDVDLVPRSLAVIGDTDW